MKDKLWIMLLAMNCFFIASYAHPGIGMVYDGKQHIYYTDLAHIWKVNITTGIKAKVLENIHSHELCMDQQGNLYGEHYWYVASEQQFKHYIWRLDAQGNFERIRQDQYGENEDFSFVRDSCFTGYQIQKTGDSFQFLKDNNPLTKLTGVAQLHEPTWKYVTADGTLFFVDYPSIYQLDDNQDLKVVAKDISASRFPFSFQSDKHNIYGIWTDRAGNTYVAIYGGRVVKKIAVDGTLHSILKTSFFWSPINGVFDKDQHLWLMESSIRGQIRVRKIDPRAWDK